MQQQRRYRVPLALAAMIAGAAAASAAYADEPIAVETPAQLTRVMLPDPGPFIAPELPGKIAPSHFKPEASNMTRIRGLIALVPGLGLASTLPDIIKNIADGEPLDAAFSEAQIQKNDNIATLGNSCSITVFKAGSKVLGIIGNPIKAIVAGAFQENADRMGMDNSIVKAVLLSRSPQKLQNDLVALQGCRSKPPTTQKAEPAAPAAAEILAAAPVPTLPIGNWSATPYAPMVLANN